MHIKEMQQHPFGWHWTERNQVEEYLRQVFIAVDGEDGLALKQLFEEMTLEQEVYIKGLCASYTRAKIKELT